ncbi:MAG: CHAT domain-containing protein [Chloroflexaceae bacterium]|jgi:tetratricopeptide (TPR) repeat protein|nr:CHAT domain-containing protein [Chloroflexaceae bacterium]
MQQPPATNKIIIALAVLGAADTAALAALVPGATLALLAGEADVTITAERATLPAERATHLLAELEQRDLTRYRQLHERAIAHLATRLQAGDAHAEASLLAAFERLGNRLLSDDPTGLTALAEQMEGLPLTSSYGQQLRRFFAAMALSFADRYSDAIATFDALLAEPELDETMRGRALNSRANCYSIIGQPEAALAGFQASLAIWQRLGNRLREGLAWLNLGITAYDLHEYGEAEEGLRQAEGCFVDMDSRQWLAAVQNELGLVYRDQGRWQEALAELMAAAEQYQAEGATDLLGHVINNIGEIYLFQGRFAEADEAFAAALAAMQTRLHAVDVHLNLGLSQQATGQLSAALASFQQALALARQIERRDILAELHYRLGEIQRLLGDDGAALAELTAAATVIESTREPLRDEGLKMSLLGRWQQVYETLVLHCLAMGRPEEAFAWAERARARAFADLVAGSDLPETAATGETSATAAAVQAALAEGETLLCYFTTGTLDRAMPLLRVLPADHPLRTALLTPPRTLLFLLTRAGLTAHMCPLDPNTFTTASPRPEERLRFVQPAALQRLRADLLGAVTSNPRRVIVAPHGPLHQVPFGALLDVPVVITPSATLWLAGRKRPPPATPAATPCLALGYDSGAGTWALRHTEAEARYIATLTDGEAWVGPAAKTTRLKEAVANVGLLHIACHGWFDPEQPLESYLETGADERLTALAVLRDWQLRAELAVLSACESGVSRVVRGDEPLGLMRAFLGAGARAVLVSQWPVDDLAAFLLMRRFYQALQEQPNDAAAALFVAGRWLAALSAAEAQALLADVPGELVGGLAALPPTARPFAHPRHWAAFMLVGG